MMKDWSCIEKELKQILRRKKLEQIQKLSDNLKQM
jgi:hypothetical protein